MLTAFPSYESKQAIEAIRASTRENEEHEDEEIALSLSRFSCDFSSPVSYTKGRFESFSYDQ